MKEESVKGRLTKDVITRTQGPEPEGYHIKQPETMSNQALKNSLCSAGAKKGECEKCQACGYGREWARREKAAGQKPEAAKKKKKAPRKMEGSDKKYQFLMDMMKARILASGLTVQQISDRSGVSRTAIYKWINGQRQPNLENYCRVMAELRMRVIVEEEAE